jgi:hypothetical protein
MHPPGPISLSKRSWPYDLGSRARAIDAVDVKKAVVEPLPLFAALRQDEDGTLPVVTAKNLISEQLADFSSSRFDGSDAGRDPVTLRVQVLYVHAWALGCIRGSSMALALGLTEHLQACG